MENQAIITTLISVGLINSIALISPGPDFVVVTRNSILHGRKVGLFCAAGIATGMLVHLTYITMGIATIIAETSWLFHLIKYFGCAYLMYIGYIAISSKKNKLEDSMSNQSKNAKTITTAKVFRIGFITNATNPKVMLFFLSLFTIVIDKHTPQSVLILCGVEIFLLNLIWFCSLAYFLTCSKIRSTLEKIMIYIDKITGSILLLLGIKIAISS